MAEFSKLNGYDVKDKTARQALAGKLGADDVVDNLTSNSAKQPLSANQGKVLDERLKVLEENNVLTLSEENLESMMIYNGIGSFDDGYAVIFIDSDGERCGCIGHTADFTVGNQAIKFFKASTNSIISISTEGEKETIKIDKAITTAYDAQTESLTISE